MSSTRRQFLGTSLKAAALVPLIAGSIRAFAAPDPAAVRQSVIRDLVIANHVLYKHDIVDGYGHISARDPQNPNQYLLSKSMAPALVTAADIVTWDLDSNPVGGDTRKGYLERFIHGEIYKVRPDVKAIVHCHTPSVIPFGATKTPLRAMYHMGYFMADGVPLYEIRDFRDPKSKTMLVENPALGKSLAKVLGPHNAALMRGHGAVIVGPSIPDAVGRSFYLKVNAAAQQDAMALDKNFMYLEPGENSVQDHARDWQLWVQEAETGCAGPAK